MGIGSCTWHTEGKLRNQIPGPVRMKQQGDRRLTALLEASSYLLAQKGKRNSQIRMKRYYHQKTQPGEFAWTSRTQLSTFDSWPRNLFLVKGGNRYVKHTCLDISFSRFFTPMPWTDKKKKKRQKKTSILSLYETNDSSLPFTSKYLLKIRRILRIKRILVQIGYWCLLTFAWGRNNLW